jgi:agmatine deiminase
MLTKDYYIWLRDYLPIVTYVNGKRYIAKAIYKPSYMYVEESKPLNSAGREIPAKLGLRFSELPLIWDGGNLTHNWKGIGIITKRLLKDNKKFNERQIRYLLKKHLGLRKIIFIDEEPFDKTGHVDGVVRFVKHNVLIVGSYPIEYKKGHKYLEYIAELLKHKLGKNFQIVRIPNEYPENKYYQGIPSAWGNRINYLQDYKKIYLPVYGLRKNDEEAINTISDLGFTVIPVRCDKLSRMGGVLNCITWQY